MVYTDKTAGKIPVRTPGEIAGGARLIHMRAIACLGLVITLITACASGPASEPAASAVIPTEKSEPIVPRFTRDQVSGADSGDLARLFNEPGLVRREGNGEFRRYGLADCSLLVILYPDDRGDMRVTHVEATALSSDDEKPDLDACLARGL